MDERLSKAREKINEVDRGIAALFEERMEAVRSVAAYKAAHGLPVLDEAREVEMIARELGWIGNAETRGYYEPILRALLSVSKAMQHSMMQGMKVAYSGIEGAFAHIAAHRVFPDGQAVSYPSFDDAYRAVVDCACDCAVLPIENSYAGEVGQVMDLMYHGGLTVSGVYKLPISQNLLGLPGARIEEIRTVISHPQALAQCAGYIARHGFAEQVAENTAIAARKVAEGGDRSVAAVAGVETADLYGLKLLDHDINESATNTTRFAVFTRGGADTLPTAGERNFILLFTVNHVPGALSEAIGVISGHGFNMRAMRSRPLRTEPWKYYFYVEAEGDESSPDGVRMLAELREHCNMLKVVGHFGAERVLTPIPKEEQP